ncbi:hypothetical protein BDF19DRAFT_468919 [Syncephalis fuscata]|nr:hypothetical protein BDF19DRAFT_468919 [Syncephalis fuscata]
MSTYEEWANYSPIEFLQHNNGTMQDIQDRSIGVSGQLMINVLPGTIFIHCTYRAVFMTIRNPNRVASWCCLILSLIGVLEFWFFLTAGYIFDIFSCKSLLWSAIISVSLAPLFVNLALLERVYIVYACKRWILIVGVILSCISPFVFIYTLSKKTDMSYRPLLGCNVLIPPIASFARVITDAPINIGFSFAFILVIYRQYKRFGAACWKELAQTGMITSMLIVASNILCMLANAASVLGHYTDMIYLADWIFTTLLLVNNTSYLETLAQRTSESRSRNQRDYMRQNSMNSINFPTETAVDIWASRPGGTMLYR